MEIFTILITVLGIALTTLLILSMFRPIRIEITRINKEVKTYSPTQLPHYSQKELTEAVKEIEETPQPLNPFNSPEKEENEVPTVSLDAVVAAANELMGVNIDRGDD